MTKRFGFTLAEVLITLGIIGVVAAMTIPNLIANTNGAKFRSQFKKSISTLSQAGLMGQAQYDFDYAGTTLACANGVGEDGSTPVEPAKQHPEMTMTFCSLLNGTLTGQSYLGAASDIKRTANGKTAAYTIKFASTMPALSDYLAYSMADGSIVAFHKDALNCELELGTPVNKDALTGAGSLAKCLGFIDVNGTTLPNKEVTCSGVGMGTGADSTDKTKGTADLEPDKPCVVKNDATHMTDVFPIVFHDANVEPASNAAKYVLTSAK